MTEYQASSCHVMSAAPARSLLTRLLASSTPAPFLVHTLAKPAGDERGMTPTLGMDELVKSFFLLPPLFTVERQHGCCTHQAERTLRLHHRPTTPSRDFLTAHFRSQWLSSPHRKSSDRQLAVALAKRWSRGRTRAQGSTRHWKDAPLHREDS